MKKTDTTCTLTVNFATTSASEVASLYRDLRIGYLRSECYGMWQTAAEIEKRTGIPKRVITGVMTSDCGQNFLSRDREINKIYVNPEDANDTVTVKSTVYEYKTK